MRPWIDLVTETEKLDELQGIKQKPRQFRDQDEFIAYMEDQGFHCLGNGLYASVFTHRAFHGKYVLKLFNDSYYEAFIALAQANPDNPHFPKFVGNVIPVTATARMVRIEVLQALHGGDIDRLLGGAVPFALLKADAAHVAEDYMEMDEVELPNPNMASLFETMVLVLKQMPPGAQPDIHMENVMKRGQTVVITDPYKGAKRFPFGRAS